METHSERIKLDLDYRLRGLHVPANISIMQDTRPANAFRLNRRRGAPDPTDEYDTNEDSNTISQNNIIKQGIPKANEDKSIDLSKYNSLPSNYANAYYQQLIASNPNMNMNLQNAIIF